MEIEWHHNSETVAQIGTQGWGIPKRYEVCSPGYRDADSFVWDQWPREGLSHGLELRKPGSYFSPSTSLLCDVISCKTPVFQLGKENFTI